MLYDRPTALHCRFPAVFAGFCMPDPGEKEGVIGRAK
jgi:hypothetical protein